jgi:hypothetical protein
MSRDTIKRKVLSVAGKVRDTRQIGNGEKKGGMCRECGLVSCTVQTIKKVEPN